MSRGIGGMSDDDDDGEGMDGTRMVTEEVYVFRILGWKEGWAHSNLCLKRCTLMGCGICKGINDTYGPFPPMIFDLISSCFTTSIVPCSRR